MNTRKGRHIVEDETGEIVCHAKVDHFAKKMTEVWRHVYKHNLFTPAEERVLNRLADFLKMNSNAVVNPNGKSMTVQQMADHIDMNRADLHRYLRQLVRKNALGIWKSGYDETYYMNPYLYEKGTVERWLFSRFNDELRNKQLAEPQNKSFIAGKKMTSLVQAL